MKKKLFLLFVMTFWVSYAEAIGLKTKFSMAIVENIFPGETYNTRELVNLPYVLTNESAYPVTGAIAINIPHKEMLIKGYEPIPDTDWIELSKTNLRLGPGESILVDIIIFVPDKEEYYGRMFQASIEACARGEKGNIAAGLASKFCFTTVPSNTQRAAVEKQKEMLANLNYEVLPDRARLRNVEPGKNYELGKDFKQFFKIVNMNEVAYTYTIKSLTSEQAKMAPHEQFEGTPDPAFIKFEKEIIEVPDNTVQKFKVFLQIPKKKEHYGRRYQFFLEVSLLGQAVPVRKFSFVYVDTVEK